MKLNIFCDECEKVHDADIGHCVGCEISYYLSDCMSSEHEDSHLCESCYLDARIDHAESMRDAYD